MPQSKFLIELRTYVWTRNRHGTYTCNLTNSIVPYKEISNLVTANFDTELQFILTYGRMYDRIPAHLRNRC